MHRQHLRLFATNATMRVRQRLLCRSSCTAGACCSPPNARLRRAVVELCPVAEDVTALILYLVAGFSIAASSLAADALISRVAAA